MEHTDKEMNEKLRKPFAELLEYMGNELESGLGSDDERFYSHDVVLGFGNRTAKIYVCPETYEIIEKACHQVIDFVDEEYSKDEPIGKIVKSYEIEYTGGNIYCVYGQFNDGRWFTGETPDDGMGLGVYKTKEEAYESMADGLIDDIGCDSAKYVLIWNEIIEDYVKNDGDFSDRVEYWKQGLYEEV